MDSLLPTPVGRSPIRHPRFFRTTGSVRLLLTKTPPSFYHMRRHYLSALLRRKGGLFALSGFSFLLILFCLDYSSYRCADLFPFALVC